jgi:hypothetical protein
VEEMKIQGEPVGLVDLGAKGETMHSAHSMFEVHFGKLDLWDEMAEKPTSCSWTARPKQQ